MSYEIRNIPVKHQGHIIGHADIDKDGTIHATINSNILNDNIKEMLRLGLADSISIKPNYTPSIRSQSLPDRKK